MKRGPGPTLREQLESELRAAIQTGRLPGGTILPSTRALAADLRISRGVTVLAYEQLIAEGYLVAEKRGSRDPRGGAPARQRTPDAGSARPVALTRLRLPARVAGRLHSFPQARLVVAPTGAQRRRRRGRSVTPSLRARLGPRAALAAYLNRNQGHGRSTSRSAWCVSQRLRPGPGGSSAEALRSREACAVWRWRTLDTAEPARRHPGDGAHRASKPGPGGPRWGLRPRNGSTTSRCWRRAGDARASVPHRRGARARAPSGSCSKWARPSRPCRDHRGRLRRRIPLRPRARRRPAGPWRKTASPTSAP